MGYSLSGDRFEYRHRRRFGETARVGRLLLCIGSMLGFGLVGHGTASAQVKYTTDDVMARVVEIDRRLVRVETEVENLKSQIREVKADLLAQMDGMKADLLGQIQGNTTTTWALFGAMITLYIAIFVVVLAIYRNVRPRPEGLEERRRTVQEDVVAEVGKLLGPLREQLRELAELEERLEKQVMALSTQ